MRAPHTYRCTITWTGNRGSGTSGYRDYGRGHDVAGDGGKATILGSSDPAFRGDASRWNPEEMLLASLSQCHMLFFLHRASESGVIVLDYVDAPEGQLQEDDQGGGRFTQVILRPTVTVAEPQMEQLCDALHDRAHQDCFIANSVNFTVLHDPTSRTRAAGSAASA